jgi:hypothetical protein
VNFGTGLQIVTNVLKTKDSEIVHSALSGYVADQHVAHAGVSISTTAPLAGGGTIAASRTLTLSYSTGLYLDGTTLKVDHDAASNFVANEHIDWTNATQNLLTTGTVAGKLVMRTVVSNPQDATPGNRPAGTVAEVVYYTGNLYFCVDAAIPTWKIITSS